MEGQIGLEPTLEAYLEKMLAVTAELKRVLRKDGVFWLNHGDCYGGFPPSGQHSGSVRQKGSILRQPKPNVTPKCLAMQNYRLILKMVDTQGWILRNVCPWVKGNSMPSSVKDRLANKYEPVFLLVKSQKYFFDLDAIRKPCQTAEGRPPGVVSARLFNYRVRDGEKKVKKCPQFKASKREIREYTERYGNDGKGMAMPNKWNIGAGKNPGDVFFVNTQPFKDSIETSRLVPVEQDAVSDGMMHIVFPDCPVHGVRFGSVASQFCGEYAIDGMNRIERIYNYLSAKLDDDVLKKLQKHTYCCSPHKSGYSFLAYFLSATAHNTEIHRKAHAPLTNLSYNSFLKILSRIDDTQDALWLSVLYLDIHGSKTWQGEMDVHLLDKIPHCIVDKSLFPYNTSCICKFYHKETQKSSHFATFPMKLIEPMIMAGCPKEICKKCGKARIRITAPTEEYAKLLGKSLHDHKNDKKQGMSQKKTAPAVTASYKTIGWTDCKCGAGFEPGVILDPFGGAMTTALVAKKLGRRWIMVELSPKYCKMGDDRLKRQGEFLNL